MSKLIGISGAHGTGKSTVLQRLQLDSSFRHRAYTESLSRAAQAKLGIDMTKAPDIHTALKLQTEIVNSLIDRDLKAHAYSLSGEVMLMDRSPADVFAYNKLWMLTNVEQLDAMDRVDSQRIGEQIAKLNNQLLQHAITYYRRIIYFPIRVEIPFVEEPGRALKETQAFHDYYLNMFLDRFRDECNTGNVVHELKEIDIGERAEEVKRVALR